MPVTRVFEYNPPFVRIIAGILHPLILRSTFQAYSHLPHEFSIILIHQRSIVQRYLAMGSDRNPKNAPLIWNEELNKG